MRQQALKTDREFFGYAIGALFLLLGGWFAYGIDFTDVPGIEIELISGDDISSKPLREIMTDPPTALMGGYDLQCIECHKLFPSLPETARRLTQHLQIKLDHGLNDRCFNCHDRENRNRLALRGTKTVPYRDVEQLCSTCHGTTFRDWQTGMHGRTNGYWNTEMGEQIRLTCTECHDPHAPAFGQMSTLPGPNTLRMGDQSPVDHHDPSIHNPLRDWMNVEDESHGSESEHTDPEEGDH